MLIIAPFQSDVYL